MKKIVENASGTLKAYYLSGGWGEAIRITNGNQTLGEYDLQGKFLSLIPEDSEATKIAVKAAELLKKSS